MRCCQYDNKKASLDEIPDSVVFVWNLSVAFVAKHPPILNNLDIYHLLEMKLCRKHKIAVA